MDNKSLLLNAGLEFFSKQPYEAVAVQEIVIKVGVTKPTLYHYFGSKLGFYQAVFTQFALPFFNKIIQITDYRGDLTKNLNELAKFSVDFFRENPDIYWLIEHTTHVSNSSELYPFLAACYQPLNQAFENMFDAASRQHGNLKGKTVLSCWMFQHALRAMVFVALTQKDVQEDLPYRMVHQFMHGIFS